MWPFYGATVFFHVLEAVDFAYLFHVSLQQNDEVWSQFFVAALVYYAAGLITARQGLRIFQPRAMVILGCTLPHILIIPLVFADLRHWYIPLFGVLGLLRVDTFATLEMAESQPATTRLQRIFHGKILQYLALLTSSVLVFLMWIYPAVSMHIVGSVHVSTLLFGLAIGMFSSPESFPPLQWEEVKVGNVPPVVMETLRMELSVTCDFYALSTHALVIFTEHHSQYVTVANAIFSLVCLVLVSISYHFLVNHHNVNRAYLFYLTSLFAAVVASMAAWIADAPPWVHLLINIGVVIFFSIVHIAPWKILNEIDPTHNYVPLMIQYRLLGQCRGMLLGIIPYRLFGGVGVYACLLPLNFSMIAGYEDAHKKASEPPRVPSQKNRLQALNHTDVALYEI